MRKHLLFVYGTLRRGGANEITKSHPTAIFRGASSVRGRIYDMDGYPAIILDETADSVGGEVFEVDDDTLAELDRFEAAADYHREQIEVAVSGSMTSCWIYRPSPEICSTQPLVDTGDWIEYCGLAD